MKSSVLLRVLLPVVIIAIACALAFTIVISKKPPEKEPVVDKAFLVEAQETFAENVEFDVYSQGNVVPKHQTRISVQVSGNITAISENFVEGGFFKKGDLLVTLEQADYLTEVKLAQAELAQAKAALDEEIARGKVAEQEWRSVNNSTPPALGLRKPQLAREKANVQAAEAKLEREKRNLARTQIKAPYDGIVVSRDVDLGQFLAIGSTIGEVFSTDVAQIRLPLTNSDLAFLNLGAGVKSNNEVALSARVAGKFANWEGRLVRSEEILDSGSRVIYAVAEVKDPYNRQEPALHANALRFGQFVKAQISGTKTESVIVLPRKLVRLDNTIITVTADRLLDIKPVTLARSDIEFVYINSGIDSGDSVVTSSVPNAFNGMKVRLPGDEPEVEEPSKYDRSDDGDEIDTKGEN